VDGDAVIGQYPIVTVFDEEPFIYQSQMKVIIRTGESQLPRMRGHFKFVEGTIAQPTGDDFDAICGEIELCPDDYVY